MSSEPFDLNAYLRCDCASIGKQTCDKCVVRRAVDDLRADAFSDRQVINSYDTALVWLGWDSEAESAEAFALRYRQTFVALTNEARDALDMIDAKRKAGDFNHWESFSMSDLAAAIADAEQLLPSQAEAPENTDV